MNKMKISKSLIIIFDVYCIALFVMVGFAFFGSMFNFPDFWFMFFLLVIMIMQIVGMRISSFALSKIRKKK